MKKGKVILRSHHKADTAKSYAELYQRYFQIGPVYFRDEFPYAFIGQRRYRLTHPTRLVDQVLMVSLEDFRVIYAQSFTFRSQDGYEVLEHGGIHAWIRAGEPVRIRSGEEERMIDEIPLVLDGILFLPVEGLMKLGYGMYTDWQKTYLAPGDYLGISEEDDLFPSIGFVREFGINATKKYGNLRECYYFRQGNTLMPYRLYVPSGYDPETPVKMIVYLHGGIPDATPDMEIDMTAGRFEHVCEEHQYLLLAVDGYAEGFYGGKSPALNPETADEEERRYLELCEQETLCAIRHVMEEYSVDRENVFLMGNSMGGAGTLYLGRKYPHMFRALAPCGCLTNQDVYSIDLAGLRGKPTLMVCGTENVGFENMRDVIRDMRTLGIDAQLLIVGGGVHENAWIIGLPEILDFFDTHAGH